MTAKRANRKKGQQTNATAPIATPVPDSTTVAAVKRNHNEGQKAIGKRIAAVDTKNGQMVISLEGGDALLIGQAQVIAVGQQRVEVVIPIAYRVAEPVAAPLVVAPQQVPALVCPICGDHYAPADRKGVTEAFAKHLTDDHTPEEREKAKGAAQKVADTNASLAKTVRGAR